MLINDNAGLLSSKEFSRNVENYKKFVILAVYSSS